MHANSLAAEPALLASYFTFAGDTVPLRDMGPSPREFRARVEAAARAGFTGFGLFFTDLPAVIERHGYAGMRAIFADNGIVHIEFEALIDWFADGARAAAAAAPRELLLRSSEALGGCHIKAGGDMSGDWPLDRMTASFAQLCDAAARGGSRISIEMIAFSNIATLGRARALVEGADRPNAGLLLDIWHFVRGGVDFAEIAGLPKRLIFGVELNDAAADVRGTLFDDTVFHRRFCGAGAFDVAGFVAAVQSTGYSGPYGVEVLSDEARRMPLDTLARTAYETTADYFRA
jgi:sugar phosphate isomerase/epimerase